jgi:hypothetical protein
VDVGVRHLPEQVVELGGHPVEVVADLATDVSQVDEETESIAVALGLLCHCRLTRANGDGLPPSLNG